MTLSACTSTIRSHLATCRALLLLAHPRPQHHGGEAGGDPASPGDGGGQAQAGAPTEAEAGVPHSGPGREVRSREQGTCITFFSFFFGKILKSRFVQSVYINVSVPSFSSPSPLPPSPPLPSPPFPSPPLPSPPLPSPPLPSPPLPSVAKSWKRTSASCSRRSQSSRTNWPRHYRGSKTWRLCRPDYRKSLLP